MKKNHLNPLWRLLPLLLVLLTGSFSASAADLNVYGDVNLDGEVTVADVNSVIDVILNSDIIPTADVNSDGEINIADINTLIDIILNGGIDPLLEVCKKVSDIDYKIQDFYKVSESLEDMKTHESEIIAMDGVEYIYYGTNSMFVVIKNFGTISYSYFPLPNEEDVSLMKEMITKLESNGRHSLPRQSETSSYQDFDDAQVLIVNQQYSDEGREYARQSATWARTFFTQSGFNVAPIENSPDVEFFRNGLFGYDYVFLITHGKYGYDPVKKVGTHWLLTSQEIPYTHSIFTGNKADPEALAEIRKSYGEEDVSVGFVKEVRNGKETTVGYLKVSEHFINSSTNQFKHPGKGIFFNVACESIEGPNPHDKDSINTSLADVFISKGVGAYIGYDRSNYGGQVAGLTLLSRLLNGHTIKNAFSGLHVQLLHEYHNNEKYWADLEMYPKNSDFYNTVINRPVITCEDKSDDSMLQIDLHAGNLFISLINPTGYVEWEQIRDYETLKDRLPFRYGFELSELEQFNDVISLGEKKIGDEGCSDFVYFLDLNQTLTYDGTQPDAKIKPGTTYWARAFAHDTDNDVYNYSEPIKFTTGSLGIDRLLIFSKEVNGIEYSLYTRIVDQNDKHVNGDGTVFYRNQITLDVANGDGKKTYVVDDEVFLPQDYSNQQQIFAMLIDLVYGQIHIFCNSKTPADNNGMNGFNYVTSMSSIDFSKETVYANQNCGWWPFYIYNDGQIFIRHFSFNGNYYMLSTRNQNDNWTTSRKTKMNPDVFKQMWEQAEHVLIVELDEPVIHIDDEGLDFGDVIIGSTKAVELKVINSSNEVKSVTATLDSFFSFSLDENGMKDKTFVVSGNSYYPLKIYFTAIEPGNYNGNIVLRSNAIEGGLCIISLQAHAETVESLTQTITVNGVSFNVIGVEGGTFMMGNNDDIDEMPIHKVTLSSFAIGQTEVTQELWQAVMGSNPSWYKGDLNCPVEHVSWHDCWAFIRKLNEMTGKCFRLPTEAEWEFAARGGNLSHGYEYSGSDNLNVVASLGSMPAAVGSKAPNELGLYDMSGNVCEWVQDWFGEYNSNDQINPRGPSFGNYIVYRGGGFNSGGCGVSRRKWDYPMNSKIDLGLRLAMSSEPEPDSQCGYVDLGLPSGTLWATMNIGATCPEEYGDYFAWGEIIPKDVYNFVTYEWCNGSYDKITKYGVDNKTELDLEDDAAYMNWGPLWRMPTDSELSELRKICTWEWTKLNGKSGYLAIGPNGKSLFFPAAGCRTGNSLSKDGLWGYYWSRTVDNSSNYSNSAFSLSFKQGNVGYDSDLRAYGYSVRAVRPSL